MTVIKLYWDKKGKCHFVTLPSSTESAKDAKRALVLSFMSDANLSFFYASKSAGAIQQAHMANYEKSRQLAQQVRNALYSSE